MDITDIFCCWGTNQTTADSSWSSQFPASRNTFNHSLPCNTVECGSVENSFRLFVFFAFSLWCKSPNHLAPSLTTSNINSPSFVSATKVIRKWRSSTGKFHQPHIWQLFGELLVVDNIISIRHLSVVTCYGRIIDFTGFILSIESISFINMNGKFAKWKLLTNIELNIWNNRNLECDKFRKKNCAVGDFENCHFIENVYF